MRTLLLTAAFVMLALLAFAQEAEKPWFDMKNCAFCKEVAAQPGLAEHMHHEYFNIKNGILSITHIDEGYWDEFAGMQAGMQKVVADMQAGKQLEMCQHCTKIGEFYMKGATVDEIKAQEEIVIVYQSADPEMVKQLHAFGDRCKEELAKMGAGAEKVAQ